MTAKTLLFYWSCGYYLALFNPFKAKREHKRNKMLDYKSKLCALRDACPEIQIKKIRILQGGWNLCFLINDKYMFKIRKKSDISDINRAKTEKRITDAFRNIVPFKIPNIDIVYAKQYVFLRYEYIDGINLTSLPPETIMKHRFKWAKQIANFIFLMHHNDPDCLSDLKTPKGDGWGHNDICNNMIVDPKTMDIVGLIDWEYSGWDFLSTEFKNCTAYSPKLQQADFDSLLHFEYVKMKNKN